MANALNVNALPDYVNEHKDELLTKATVDAKTLGYVDIMANVKYKEAIPYLSSTVVLADGSVCNFNPEGEDVISNRFVEVVPIKIEKEWCWKEFRKKFANYQLKWEAGRETLPFEEKIADSNMNEIKAAVEALVWTGNTELGIDGFIKQATDEGKKVEVASGATATEAIDAVIAGLTTPMLKKGVNVFVSYTLFRQYVMEQNASCCANRTLLDAGANTLAYVGDSRITIVPVEGLEGADAIVAATADALVYATDIEDSENVYRYWYNEDEDTMRFRVLFNAGTALRFPDEVVIAAL